MKHPNHSRYAPDREELLLHRAVEGIATPEEWAEIDALANLDAAVLRRLANSMRDEARVKAYVRDGIESIEAPLAIEAVDRARVDLEVEATPILRGVSRSGWLAAAASILLWVTTVFLRIDPSSPVTSSPALSSSASSSPTPFSSVAVTTRLDNVSTQSRSNEPFVRVLDDGATTQSNLSRTLVDARRSDSGWELLYLCRGFERVQVSELTGTALDDSGAPRLVPISISDPSEWREF